MTRGKDGNRIGSVGVGYRPHCLGDTYPPGLYVGRITELVPNALNHTVNAVVKPSGGVYDTDLVMVITSFDRSVTQEPTDDSELPAVPETPEAVVG